MFIADAQTLYINVKDYGALGNGVTDDTTAIQNAINSLPNGGTVFFPPGTYMCSGLTFPHNNTQLLGAGREATTLKKNTNCDLVDISGAQNLVSIGLNHKNYCSIRDMTLHGNNLTGKLIRAYYASYFLCDTVHFGFNNDMALETAEFWDSYFLNCHIDKCGDTAGVNPAFYLKNAAATVGNFGWTTDNTNMIWFVNCRWEGFYNGAMRIEQLNGNTNNPNGIYLINCKMETSTFMGRILKVGDGVNAFHAVNLYMSANSFNSGYSTPTAAIWCSAANDYSFENVFVNANAAVLTCDIDLFPSSVAYGVIRGLIHSGVAPSLASIHFSGGNPGASIRFEDIKSTGTLYSNQSGNAQIYNIKNHDQAMHNPAFSSSYTPDVLNSGGLVVINPVTGALTINAPAMRWSSASLKFILTSDGTGGYALTWNPVYKANQNALPTVMPGPNLTISIEFVSDGTNWYRVN